jgi:hypothetical protein
VPAAPHVDGLGASFEIAGRAPAGTTVSLSANCVMGPCTSAAVANRKGRWSTIMNLVTGLPRRHVRVVATDGSAHVGKTFTLTLPAYASFAPYNPPEPAPQLAVVGDSLAVGTDLPLRAALPGWKVTTQGRVGRPLAEGMAVLGWTPTPDTPIALAFSLFTNDDPRHVDDLDAAVRASVDRLGPADCAIWATIVRPKVAGVTYGAANRALRALAEGYPDRVLIVDWARAVKRHPEWISKDGVHPGEAGYAARAQLYANQAMACQTHWQLTGGSQPFTR